jgi:hypothetical protein
MPGEIKAMTTEENGRKTSCCFTSRIAPIK